MKDIIFLHDGASASAGSVNWLPLKKGKHKRPAYDTYKRCSRDRVFPVVTQFTIKPLLLSRSIVVILLPLTIMLWGVICMTRYVGRYLGIVGR